MNELPLVPLESRLHGWEMPMSDAPKNTTVDGLYRAVGEAISTWTAVENQLHQIFGICTSMVAMQPGGGFSFDSTIPSAVLDSIDGLRGKLLMIEAALHAGLRDLGDEAASLEAEGRLLLSFVRGVSGKRNKLAHWAAGERLSHDLATRTPVLQPPHYSLREHQGVTETDIDQWSQSFIEANKKLSNFGESLASYRGLQLRHLELATSQVRCTLPGDPTLLDHIRNQLWEHL